MEFSTHVTYSLMLGEKITTTTTTNNNNNNSSSVNPVLNASNKSESNTIETNGNQAIIIKDSGLSSANSSLPISLNNSQNSDHEMSETELLFSENNSSYNSVSSNESIKESVSSSNSSSSASFAQSSSNENSSSNK